MQLSETDEELLELLTLEVPWHLVCGEFHERYGSPGALAVRVCELAHAELIGIRRADAGAPAPTPAALEADALAHGCYEDLEDTWKPRWNLVATDAGNRLVRHRLGEQ